MNISIQQNINFTSRNATIRRAEDIARRVKNAFPMQSPIKFGVYVSAPQNLLAIIRLDKKLNLMREYMKEKVKEEFSFIGQVKKSVSPIKKNKVGNCGEATLLTAIAAKVNGIKGVYTARLASDKKALDHDLVFINAEKPYVIDTWLGFADYEQNAISRLKNEYKKHFNFADEEWDNLRIVRYKDLGCYKTIDRELYPNEINSLKKLYPGLVLKNADK